MYGNIFLDGYHGLTKNMLVDFLKKDNDGNYLIVDQLLKMAEYFKLDGFF
jgi:endo-beta-N-acetylglucosaminidase D